MPVSERQFQAWRDHCRSFDASRGDRVRAEVEAEFAEFDRERADAAERQRGALAGARALRHADQLPARHRPHGAEHRSAIRGDTERAEAAEAERRAAIRREVEREMAEHDRRIAPRPAPARSIAQPPASAARTTTRIGEVRTYRDHGSYRWDGAVWQRVA